MMSFGLTNAPAYFMDQMDKVFMEFLDKFIIVFIGGILAYSKSKEEHKERPHLVLQKLQDHRLYAKLSKCLSYVTSFWKKECPWIQARFEICQDGMHLLVLPIFRVSLD
jgi:hypothetical protein